MSNPPRVRLLLAFAAVYVIWGSTYLAIRYAVETIPPFSGAGVRFVVAGLVLYLWRRIRGDLAPEPVHWRTAAVVGALLLLGGNGVVFWAEQTVPSGSAALIIASVPLWMAVMTWATGGGRPSRLGAVGLVVGFGGVALLIGPEAWVSGSAAWGSWALLFASASWAAGSLYSRSAPHPSSPMLGSAMTMLAGGVWLVVVAAALGEWRGLEVGAFSAASLWALGYLVVFGSMVAFSAYLWLMKNTAPARAATYAYVNPVVAVGLGWALADEVLDARIGIAAAVVVGSVALIVSAPTRMGGTSGGGGVRSGGPAAVPSDPSE